MTVDVKRLRELLRQEDGTPWTLDRAECMVRDSGGYRVATCSTIEGRIIVEAVNALPSLLDALEAKERRIEELRDALADAAGELEWARNNGHDLDDDGAITAELAAISRALEGK